MALLELRNVEVIYDRVFLAVKGVSLEVPEGRIVALLGSNGAGKSTTLKAISGLLGPERGELTRGRVLYTWSRTWAHFLRLCGCAWALPRCSKAAGSSSTSTPSTR